MPFLTQRRVEFRDTDAAGIVHFSAFFPMMETAEHELLRSIGIEIMPPAIPGQVRVTWPRVSACCDYRAAARFEDVLSIEVRVAKVGTSSVRYGFGFCREGVSIADGALTAVCCRLAPGGGLEKVVIPDEIRARLATVG